MAPLRCCKKSQPILQKSTIMNYTYRGCIMLWETHSLLYQSACFILKSKGPSPSRSPVNLEKLSTCPKRVEVKDSTCNICQENVAHAVLHHKQMEIRICQNQSIWQVWQDSPAKIGSMLHRLQTFMWLVLLCCKSEVVFLFPSLIVEASVFSLVSITIQWSEQMVYLFQETQKDHPYPILSYPKRQCILLYSLRTAS